MSNWDDRMLEKLVQRHAVRKYLEESEENFNNEEETHLSLDQVHGNLSGRREKQINYY
jgi:hypothetical protein